MKKQVSSKAYQFEDYCDLDRWSSYWHQINEVLSKNSHNILEIGIGDGVFSNFIKNNTDILYKSLDIAEDLHPDIIASVDSMPFENNSFDLVCAFEVLEHLPFEKFSKALAEIKRISKGSVIISLPHWGRHFSFDVRFPFVKRIRAQMKFNFPAPAHVFNGQHYWEIGKRGYSVKKIKQEIFNCGLELVRDFIVFESPYHHFFILQVTPKKL